MKALLMYRDRDFDTDREPPDNADDLIDDLGLDPVFDAMAAGDDYLRAIARLAILTGPDDPDTIGYRQGVLRDCLAHPDVVREIYDVAADASAGEKKFYFGILSTRNPEYTLHRSLQVMQMFMEHLRQLRRIRDDQHDRFGSDGFTALFDTLARELSDEYFDQVDAHLKRLRFRNGVLISARLGNALAGADYILRRPLDERPGWWRRIVGDRPEEYSFTVPERDEAGARALTELRGRGVNLVANALGQSADHILSFFRLLRAELAFYLGAVNLHTALTEKQAPVCFPEPAEAASRILTAEELYDVALRLRTDDTVVGNDLTADGSSLIMVTGANQGGKSTFLRSVGLAQLLMQAGCVVPARRFTASVVPAVFTHYKREEDATMESGKFDEELKRMSGIADRIGRYCLLLCNESFASTNEFEGSEIGRQIIGALTEAGVRVVFVTHMYDLARSLHDRHAETAVFLRAERLADGRRSFRVAPAEPLSTSYGEDLYEQVFGVDAEAAR
jgi:DNA mismatch repair ATPase MutS